MQRLQNFWRSTSCRRREENECTHCDGAGVVRLMRPSGSPSMSDQTELHTDVSPQPRSSVPASHLSSGHVAPPEKRKNRTHRVHSVNLYFFHRISAPLRSLSSQRWPFLSLPEEEGLNEYITK